MKVHLHGLRIHALWLVLGGHAELLSTMGEGAGRALAAATLAHEAKAKISLQQVGLLAQFQILSDSLTNHTMLFFFDSDESIAQSAPKNHSYKVGCV